MIWKNTCYVIQSRKSIRKAPSGTLLFTSPFTHPFFRNAHGNLWRPGLSRSQGTQPQHSHSGSQCPVDGASAPLAVAWLLQLSCPVVSYEMEESLFFFFKPSFVMGLPGPHDLPAAAHISSFQCRPAL